jgi:hypothetical protein
MRTSTQDLFRDDAVGQALPLTNPQTMRNTMFSWEMPHQEVTAIEHNRKNHQCCRIQKPLCDIRPIFRHKMSDDAYDCGHRQFETGQACHVPVCEEESRNGIGLDEL